MISDSGMYAANAQRERERERERERDRQTDRQTEMSIIPVRIWYRTGCTVADSTARRRCRWLEV